MAAGDANVEVTLLDADSGETLGVVEVPAGNLPESFATDTTLHLGEAEWNVIEAQPVTRAEFAKSKRLTLRLARVEIAEIDPATLLFSLPSICDSIPAVGDEALTGREFVLAEDDWRQLELVSRALAAEVDAEIAQIRQIHETQSTGAGWRQMHVRKTPESPLVCRLTLTELLTALAATAPEGVAPQSVTPEGAAYRHAPGPIVDGYAFAIEGGLMVYGVAPGGIVQAIVFEQYGDGVPTPAALERLARFATDYQLDLVHWCRCARVDSDSPWFQKLLCNDMT